jgi:hypothetical protein
MSTAPCYPARSLLSALVLIIASTGCASRAAPFNKLDDAQVTILKLQQPQAAPAPAPGGGLAIPIPGLTPEQQQQINQFGQAAVQQLQQMGVLPPNFQLPGQPGTPVQPPMPMFRNQYAIADQRPVADEDLKEKLLDLFGDEDNFNDQRGNCFVPGMAISFVSPEFPEPQDVVISLSCNQAVGYGFQWPHKSSGFTSETQQTLTQIYQNHFGPVPPGA